MELRAAVAGAKLHESNSRFRLMANTTSPHILQEVSGHGQDQGSWTIQLLTMDARTVVVGT